MTFIDELEKKRQEKRKADFTTGLLVGIGITLASVLWGFIIWLVLV